MPGLFRKLLEWAFLFYLWLTLVHRQAGGKQDIRHWRQSDGVMVKVMVFDTFTTHARVASMTARLDKVMS